MIDNILENPTLEFMYKHWVNQGNTYNKGDKNFIQKGLGKFYILRDTLNEDNWKDIMTFYYDAAGCLEADDVEKLEDKLSTWWFFQETTNHTNYWFDEIAQKVYDSKDATLISEFRSASWGVIVEALTFYHYITQDPHNYNKTMFMKHFKRCKSGVKQTENDMKFQDFIKRVRGPDYMDDLKRVLRKQPTDDHPEYSNLPNLLKKHKRLIG